MDEGVAVEHQLAHAPPLRDVRSYLTNRIVPDERAGLLPTAAAGERAGQGLRAALARARGLRLRLAAAALASGSRSRS